MGMGYPVFNHKMSFSWNDDDLVKNANYLSNLNSRYMIVKDSLSADATKNLMHCLQRGGLSQKQILIKKVNLRSILNFELSYVLYLMPFCRQVLRLFRAEETLNGHVFTSILYSTLLPISIHLIPSNKVALHNSIDAN